MLARNGDAAFHPKCRPCCADAPSRDFDDPGGKRQSNPANSAALKDAMVRAIVAADTLKN
ncbi:hypothetical protein [Bradyrhizobium sp. USDA 4473]